MQISIHQGVFPAKLLQYRHNYIFRVTCFRSFENKKGDSETKLSLTSNFFN